MLNAGRSTQRLGAVCPHIHERQRRFPVMIQDIHIVPDRQSIDLVDEVARLEPDRGSGRTGHWRANHLRPQAVAELDDLVRDSQIARIMTPC